MALEDDVWALNRLQEWIDGPPSEYVEVREGSYRYADADGVVHRAWWANARWMSLCGDKKPPPGSEQDPGAVTCIECLGKGA